MNSKILNSMKAGKFFSPPFLEKVVKCLGNFLFLNKNRTGGCGSIIIFKFLHESKNNPHQIPENIEKIITFFFPTFSYNMLLSHSKQLCILMVDLPVNKNFRYRNDNSHPHWCVVLHQAISYCCLKDNEKHCDQNEYAAKQKPNLAFLVISLGNEAEIQEDEKRL